MVPELFLQLSHFFPLHSSLSAANEAAHIRRHAEQVDEADEGMAGSNEPFQVASEGECILGQSRVGILRVDPMYAFEVGDRPVTADDAVAEAFDFARMFLYLLQRRISILEKRVNGACDRLLAHHGSLKHGKNRKGRDALERLLARVECWGRNSRG